MSENTTVVLPHDLAHMALCGAVRYYVGRGTIASCAVADGIRRLLPQISDGTKGVMARDIRREIDRQEYAGMMIIDDMAPWKMLLDAIEEELC